jgi:FAD/FMN-containing dehydrogenase
MPDYKLGSLMITEVYVPRNDINIFIERIAGDAKKLDFNIIYGTMRLIEQDDESFLAWAKQNYACIIFNLRVEHTEQEIEKAKIKFQKIIDRALELNGSYFLTYHRWAKKEQILKAYPQFIKFLKLKLKYDPNERFQSDWYRHYKKMFELEIELKFN